MIKTTPQEILSPAPATSPAWDEKLLQSPHTVADKRRRVQQMFAAIAPSYDLNNHLHSMWMDQAWRRKAVQLSTLNPSDRIVDVACGTGDLTLAFFSTLFFVRGGSKDPRIAEAEWFATPGQVIGIDFTYPMLAVAKMKGVKLRAGPYTLVEKLSTSARANIAYINGDAQSLPLPDQSADVVSIAFGIRNVQDVPTALKEFHRILRPGGRLIILEFSLPTNPLMRGMYNFYFRKILPRTATLISGDKTGAYKYLPESVNTFIGRQQMMDMMTTAGFTKIEQFPMTFGVCICYRGYKM